ncbi:sporulation integral membrane protein YtvI [Cohnella zeiphila]|uniref:Sporulation integral membrane protein YtvI n=1 Tax=Cohnella zeiphila TaxID=2761120 RepID=A0A7X0VXE3_9BACL|nr:sporulation integral membrane protein YtvI [Cohnella zeiphila]MBB6733510.1 sporulation integral membrane protein YtvI [Cohnella zeiphila]
MTTLKTVLVMGFGLLFLYLLFTVGAPFLLALVAVIFLEPLNALLIRRFKLGRLAAATVSATLFTAVLIGLMVLIGLKLVDELLGFWEHVPTYLNHANAYIQDLLNRADSLSGKGEQDLPLKLENWVSSLTSALESLASAVSGVLYSFAKGIPNFFIVLVVFLCAVYLLGFSLPAMKTSFLSLFEEQSREQVEQVMANLRRSVFGFLRAQILLSLVTYVLSFFGLLIIGTGYPLAVALLIVAVDILPILGTGAVLVPWAAYAFATGDTYTAVGLLLLFFVITIVRRTVEPKVLGDAVGIGALSALVSLYVGYELVGLVGVFLGPIVVIVFTAARKAGLLHFKIKLQ